MNRSKKLISLAAALLVVALATFGVLHHEEKKEKILSNNKMKFDFIFGKLGLGNDKGPTAVEIVRLSEEIVNTQKVSRHTISGIILTAF